MSNREYIVNDESLVTSFERLNTQEENAIIKIKTLCYDQDGEDDEMDLLTKGVYRKRGNLSQILYQDSEATGFYDCETRLIAHGNSSVSIVRQGEKVGSDLIVQQEKKLYSQYKTPMGGVCIGIMGNQIDNRLGESGGTLYLRYTIDMNGSFVSENEISITVELI